MSLLKSGCAVALVALSGSACTHSHLEPRDGGAARARAGDCQCIAEDEPATAPEPVHQHPHPHPVRDAGEVEAGAGRVISHSDLKTYENKGAQLTGLATLSLGAKDFEIWRSSIPPGGATPLHVHDTEEVFVVLRGKGEMQVGDDVIPFEAPATVIAPASVPHQLRNTGDVPTDQIVVVGIGSEIKNDAGEVMKLPWRN